MTAEVRRGIVLAVAGLLGGFAMVVALFGTGELLKRNAAVNTPADAPAGADPTGKPQAGGGAPSGTPLAALTTPPQGESAAPTPVRPEPVVAGGIPTFDIVRIEKDGASVIAGRAAPNARVELLRDGQPIASTVADAAGQFAVTPPDLPPGSSEIALSASGPDGKPLRGRESVTVVVAEKRDARPLIALSAPDAPTRVLSQPDAPEASPGKAPVAAMARNPDGAAPDAAKDKAASNTSPPQREAAARPEVAPKAVATARDTLPVRIVSVDAQEGGRLDVTGQASPDSTLRLYLNDTMVASGRTGPDGRIAFTIGRGVRAGAYQIRLDAVDPAGGKVKRRAEVAFAYPENLASAAKPAVAIPGSGKPAGEAAAKAPAAAPPASAAASPTSTAASPTSAAAPSPSATAPPAAAGSPAASAGGPTPGGPSPSARAAAPSQGGPAPIPGSAPEGSRTALAVTPDRAPSAPGTPVVPRAPWSEPNEARRPAQADRAETARTPTLAPDNRPLARPPETVPAPSLALAPPAVPNPAPSGRPTSEGSATASMAASAGAGAPTPDRDDRAASALSPVLSGAATPAPAPSVRDQAARRIVEPDQSSVTGAMEDRPGTVFVPEVGTARITRGDSLWQISRRTYGKGNRYTVIYDANQEQIRNPDLIYPGQIFVLPKDSPAASGPPPKRS